MIEMRGYRTLVLSVAGLALSGCVAAVPIQATLTVIPGQGKTEANLRADDAACRGGAVPASTSRAAAAPETQASAVTADQYYACMASRGEDVVQQQPQAYPAYAYAAPAYLPYAYPAVGAYPYYGYGYGNPYGVGYLGPYVGFGVGFGYGGFYGGRGGYGGYGGGFHGGGYHR